MKCRGYSLGLQRAITDFGADDAFGDAPQKLKEHYGIDVPVSSVRAITERHGTAILSNREILQTLPRGGVEQLIGEMDGSMVPIVTIEERRDKHSPADGRKRRRLIWREARLCMARDTSKVSRRYGATMGTPEQAGELLVDCVIRTGGGRGTHLHCLGDGAIWIVSQVMRRLGGPLRLLSFLIDFYHLSEYLAAAAAVIAGEGKAEWLEKQQQRMKKNKAREVLEELKACKHHFTGEDEDAVEACRRYMERRLEYFDYAGAIKEGLPIGTGEVESGHRSVIQPRLKIPGAWWKEENAESMLALRTLRANGDWEAYWLEVRQAAA